MSIYAAATARSKHSGLLKAASKTISIPTLARAIGVAYRSARSLSCGLSGRIVGATTLDELERQRVVEQVLALDRAERIRTKQSLK
jgi:hypothetical protein